MTPPARAFDVSFRHMAVHLADGYFLMCRRSHLSMHQRINPRSKAIFVFGLLNVIGIVLMVLIPWLAGAPVRYF